MRKKKNLLALIGTLILLLGLSVPIIQCAPAAEEEVTPPSEEEEVTPPSEEEIEYGGRLVIGYTDPIDSMVMDEDFTWTGMGCGLGGGNNMLYDGLSRVPKGPNYFDYAPCLCQSFETEDGKTWILHLAENVKWHDGVPFTAEDLKFTWDNVWPHPGFWEVFTDSESTEVIDEHTLKVVLKAPIATWYGPPTWTYTPVVPKHIFEPYKDNIQECPNEEAIATGPYKLKEFVANQYIWLEVNEDYWGGRPYLDEVIMKLYGGSETMFMALEHGECDVVSGISTPFGLVDDLQQATDVNVADLPGNDMATLVFNLHQDLPYKDINVRRAIAHAIDRDKLIDLVYGGLAVKIDSIVFNEDIMHNENLPQYDYDLNKANTLLDDGGYLDSDGDGIRNDPATGENLAFELLINSANQPTVKCSTVITENLAEVGIAIDMRAVDSDTFSDYMFNPLADAYQIAYTELSPGPSPFADWAWIYFTSTEISGGWAHAVYDNPVFDELYAAMGAAESLEERKEVEDEMQLMLQEDLPYIYLVRPAFLNAHRTDKFEGWVPQVGGFFSWMSPWSALEVHLK